MELLLTAEFWKILGTISVPILGIVGAVVTILKQRLNNDVRIIEERYKTKMQEKVHAVNNMIQEMQSEVRSLLTQHKSELAMLKQEVEYKLNTNTRDMEHFFEKYEEVITGMKTAFSADLEQLTTEMLKSSDVLSSRLLNLESSVETLAEKFNEIEVAKLAKKEFVDQLNRILKNALNYMPRPLQPFALMKGSNFIDFVMYIRSMDFNTIDASLVLMKGESSSEEIYREGSKLLGEAFLAKYYENHSKRVTGFLERIVYIIEEQEQDKKFSFQTVCLTFLESFLRMLAICYQENMSLVQVPANTLEE